MIEKFAELIKSLPVNEYGCTTKRSTWHQEEKEQFLCFKKLNDSIFNGENKVFIDRLRIKNLGKTDNIKQFIFETIYWGYPDGFPSRRFNHTEVLLSNIEQWVNLIELIKQEKNILNFKEFYKINVRGVKRLGISTFTKFLSFLDIKVNGFTPVILDDQIVSRLTHSNFKDSKFAQLTTSDDSKVNHYERYLNHVESLASLINSTPEKIEMFLFVFGKTVQ